MAESGVKPTNTVTYKHIIMTEIVNSCWNNLSKLDVIFLNSQIVKFDHIIIKLSLVSSHFTTCRLQNHEIT